MLFDMTAGSNSRKIMALDPNFPKDVSLTVIRGNTVSASFNVAIADHGNPEKYTYQWYVNGNPVEGATNDTFTKEGLSETEVLTIFCEVTNKAGTVRSRVATLSVEQLYKPVLSDTFPKDESVEIHNSITSKVQISEDGNPADYTYQWFVNGAALEGANSNEYTFIPTDVGETTLYCEVSNSVGKVTSRTATITATPYYIFKSGVGATSGFTWESYNLFEASIDANEIWCNAPGLTESNGACGLTGAYDFTKYKRLVFETYSRNSNFRCGYLNSVLNNYNPSLIGKVKPETDVWSKSSIYIENVSGYKYIAMKIGDGASGAASVYNIYLE